MEKEKNFDYFSLYSSSDLFSYADYIIGDWGLGIGDWGLGIGH